MNASIPIFIITCNRILALEQSLASYANNIHTPHEIVIHDNHSTFPPMLAYLEQLEASGVKVYRSHKDVHSAGELDGVRASITDWYKYNDAPYYVVTDPDIEIDEGPGDILAFYAHMLDALPKIDVVGPMLHVDDLPDHYPLKQSVIARRRAWFGARRPSYAKWSGIEVPYFHAPVDTTFGMYRKRFNFRRLAQGVRVLPPYDARHLDWYIDPSNMSEDQTYYMNKASEVGHWGAGWLRPHVIRRLQKSACLTPVRPRGPAAAVSFSQWADGAA